MRGGRADRGDAARAQVTDTPGLLARPDADRNAMEHLTLACLAHLPTRVLFVLDLTAECGTSVARGPAPRLLQPCEVPIYGYFRQTAHFRFVGVSLVSGRPLRSCIDAVLAGTLLGAQR